MPIANNFAALGFFPSCLDKVDVFNAFDCQPGGDPSCVITTFEIWSTLGGFQSNDLLDVPTDLQIQTSIEVGMAIYWNIYGMDVTASAEYADNPTFTASLDGVSMADATDPMEIGIDPVTRVCENNPSVQRIDRDGVNLYPRCFANISGMSIVRMYRGDVDNEANFIGLGLQSTSPSFSVDSQAGSRSNCRIEIRSMIVSKSVDDSNDSYDYAVVQIGNGYFVVESHASGLGTLTVDASTMSASSEYTNVTGDYNTSAAITDFTFYTYE